MHRFVWREVDESHALFKVVIDYTYALDTLDDYDYQRLSINQTTSTKQPWKSTVGADG